MLLCCLGVIQISVISQRMNEMNLSICSYNVRGLGNKTKREQIFSWLKDTNFVICLLQETHSGDGNHDIWKSDWGNDAFFSGHSNNNEGIASFF